MDSRKKLKIAGVLGMTCIGIGVASGYLVHDAVPEPVAVDNADRHRVAEKERDGERGPVRAYSREPVAPSINAERRLKDLVKEEDETVSPANVEKSPERVVQEEFGYWMSKARKAGIDVPTDFAMPADLCGMFAREHAVFERRVKAVEEIRMPIVENLAQQLQQAGRYEEFRNPDTLQGEEANAQKKAIRFARRPTKDNQTVVIAGEGPWLRLIRVNATEDYRLQQAYDMLTIATREYVNNVALYIAPRFNR
jgi:hypothetical protein